MPGRLIISGDCQPNDICTTTRTDDQGRFTLRGYKDAVYRVIAFDNLRLDAGDTRGRETGSVDNVVLKQDLADLNIVLSPVGSL